jgi:two-component system response regulator GlrR
MQDLIWLIDDDEQLADILSLTLETQGYDVCVSRSSEQALGILADRDRIQNASAVLLDLRLADQDGLTLLPKLREELPEAPIFIITAHGDVDSAVEAFTLGANGYIRKPFEEGELTQKLRQAIDQYRLKRELRSLRMRSNADENIPRVSDLIPSRDPAMAQLLKKVELAANVMSNCVIHGESGTGKELVARALHQLSPRCDGPFIAFNCAALPESLMESELFGHVRGAFTDAKEAKSGLFARANGGTLFLDEIGDAPLSIQSKLLRVLQEREVLPLGATTPVKVDVRVVAATHKCLKTEVEQKRFRLDLYYRLNVLRLEIPPLRDRPRDILFLASVFAEKLAREMNFKFSGFTGAAQEEMSRYSWPGNVRELQNRIEQAIALGGGGIIPSRHLFPEREPTDSHDAEALEANSDFSELNPADETLPSYQEAKIDFERNYLERVLQAAKGNIAKASRLASKSRTEVYGLLRKHGLNPVLFKTSDPDEDDNDSANQA